MTDVGSLAQEAIDRVAAQHVGLVVAALTPEATEIRGAGRTGDGQGAPGAGRVFEIGSVTKVFTALTLAHLVVKGQAGLDEPLAELLPEGTNLPTRDGTRITLRHLATHTSGLPRLPKGMLLEALLRPSKPDPYAHCTTDVLLSGLAATKLGAVPGRRFRYSNLGAGLLGLALAHRAGTDYATLIDREILSPLGLTGTGLTDDRLVQGHSGRGRPTAPWHLADLAGAGGLRSTAADLAVFVRAQLEGADEAIRLTRETEHRINPFAWVHLGWLGQRLHPKQGGHLRIWHNGGTGGFRSYVGFDPEKGVAVIMIGNSRRSVDRPATDLLGKLQTAYA